MSVVPDCIYCNGNWRVYDDRIYGCGTVSEAQKRYLRKKFAQERDMETGCDCPGCEKCRGFVRGCTCDHDLSWLRLRHESAKDMEMGDAETLDTGQPGRSVGSGSKSEEFPF